jgi:hypothetical protein
VARLALPLSAPQARLLTFLARDSVWHNRLELGSIKLLEDGDAHEVDALEAAGLVVVRDDAVRISPEGSAAAEQECPPVVSKADQLKAFLAEGPFFHGQTNE